LIKTSYICLSERRSRADLLKEIVIIIDFQTIIFPLANNIQKTCSQITNKDEWLSWTIIEANLFGIMSIIKFSK